MTGEQQDRPPGPELTSAERELAILRRVLTVGLVVAILAASVAAWSTIHPLAGAAVGLIATGGWWVTVTGREHQIRASTAAALALARDRSPFVAPDGPARPDVPPWSVKS